MSLLVYIVHCNRLSFAFWGGIIFSFLGTLFNFLILGGYGHHDNCYGGGGLGIFSFLLFLVSYAYL